MYFFQKNLTRQKEIYIPLKRFIPAQGVQGENSEQ